MITDEIMEALEMLSERADNRYEKHAIACVMSMFGDFSEDHWQSMNEGEREEWIKKYIDEQNCISKN